jgi:hypothetical protein
LKGAVVTVRLNRRWNSAFGINPTWGRLPLLTVPGFLSLVLLSDLPFLFPLVDLAILRFWVEPLLRRTPAATGFATVFGGDDVVGDPRSILISLWCACGCKIGI